MDEGRMEVKPVEQLGVPFMNSMELMEWMRNKLSTSVFFSPRMFYT